MSRSRLPVLGWGVNPENTIALVKLRWIPLLANKNNNHSVHGISSLLQSIDLAVYQKRPLIGNAHRLTLVSEHGKLIVLSLPMDEAEGSDLLDSLGN